MVAQFESKATPSKFNVIPGLDPSARERWDDPGIQALDPPVKLEDDKFD